MPVACALGPDDGQARLRRWQRLNDFATPSTRFIAGTLQVRYSPGPGVHEELTDLAAAEQTCCSFVTWSVTTIDGQPVLVVQRQPKRPTPLRPSRPCSGPHFRI